MNDQTPLPVPVALRALTRCVARTAMLLARRRIHLPRAHVGTRLRFADGTSARVYRETVVTRPAPRDPCVLSDAAALTVAFADAQRHGTRLTVLHAFAGAGSGHSGHDVRARVEREATQALGPWRTEHPDVPVDLRVVSGPATSHLLEASVSARLLVLGTRARGPVTRTVLGSTSRAVVRRAPCPVMVVRRDARLVESTASPTSVAPPTQPAGPASWTLRPRDRGELW
jgi:nucleotide-binding universal stress UspA family protein